jgi:uncharacterized membrane protein YphA (DoxX/SURF4 family)
MKPVRAAARALLSGIFIMGGARSISDPGPHIAQAKRVTDRVTPLLEWTHPAIPTDVRALVRINGAVQVAGGLLLATGRLTRPAAAALAGTMVPTTLAGHPFWTVDDAAERASQRIHFLKNVGLLGGLLLAAVDTGGRPGLRYRTGHAVGHTGRAVRRGGHSVRRAVRTARRDARIAVRSASAARRLPG